ncbi:MAG TPA: 2-C-methyl-D-erythritol 4-phosphate cytidylyltransferase [Guyparkeria sp.]|nr:2-C-methyl-D-erythritol 4-phosphate cytidylyltransferase [Guyparkeria sp.]
MIESPPLNDGAASSRPERRWWLLLAAAGSGRRMCSEQPKQYLPLGDRSVLEITLSRFTGLPGLAGVILVTTADPPEGVWRMLEAAGLPIYQAVGGTTRGQSVRNGLALFRERGLGGGRNGEGEWIMVHDAARPCVRPEDIRRLLESVDTPDGGLLAAPVRDTIKRVDAEGRVAATVDRNPLMHALTPQLFPVDGLLDALESSLVAGCEITDESSAMERAGMMPRAVPGAADNIKITHPEDLAIARAILVQQGVLDD